MRIARKFLAAVLLEGSTAKLMKLGPVAHLFRANEVELWRSATSI